MKQMTFLDLCSGIGGFRLGLETAGHKCIGYCEFDKFARASYEAMYNTEGEWKANDVTKLRADEIPYADIWCFGFPCQDISVAGKQKGLVGKRSGIYFNIIDLIKSKEESDKPTYLLVENVKNLLSIHSGFDFAAVLAEMDEAGYDCRWQVLNSKNFGVPQNRERVFIIANLRSRGRREILSLSGENETTLNQLVGGMQGYRVYGTDGISATLVGNAGGVGAKTGLYFIDQSNHAPKVTDTARCLTARYTAGMTNHSAMNSAVMEVHPVLTPERMEKRQNGRRMKEDGEPMFTLTSQDRHGVYLCHKVNKEVTLKVKNATKQGYEEAHVGDGINLAYPESKTRRGRVGKECSQTLDCSGQMGTLMRCGRIRRLTPRECFRLQGFPDTLYERAASVNSDAQLYKQAGNAVTATVAYADGTYQTIEGNTSVGNDSNGGCVMERKRTVSTIHCIVRPKYVAAIKDGTKVKKSATSKENPYQEPSTNVKMKQTGNSVKWVQWELKKSGYSLLIDGDFGKNTKAAVKAFQKKKGLVVDGIVGQKTRAALKKAQ